MGETLNRLDQISKSVADSTGLSQSQVASIAFGAAGPPGIKRRRSWRSAERQRGQELPVWLIGTGTKVLGSMSNEQLAEFKQFGDRVSRDASFMSTIANDSREHMKWPLAWLPRMHDRSALRRVSLKRTAFAERVSAAHEKGETISIDIAQDPHNLEMFMRYAEQYGGNSAAAHPDGIRIGAAISSPESSVLRRDRITLPPLAISGTSMCISEAMLPLRPISPGCTNPTGNKHHGLETPTVAGTCPNGVACPRGGSYQRQ